MIVNESSIMTLLMIFSYKSVLLLLINNKRWPRASPLSLSSTLISLRVLTFKHKSSKPTAPKVLSLFTQVMAFYLSMEFLDSQSKERELFHCFISLLTFQKTFSKNIKDLRYTIHKDGHVESNSFKVNTIHRKAVITSTALPMSRIRFLYMKTNTFQKKKKLCTVPTDGLKTSPKCTQ